jgi:hypothetical protein
MNTSPGASRGAGAPDRGGADVVREPAGLPVIADRFPDLWCHRRLLRRLHLLSWLLPGRLHLLGCLHLLRLLLLRPRDAVHLMDDSFSGGQIGPDYAGIAHDTLSPSIRTGTLTPSMVVTY